MKLELRQQSYNKLINYLKQMNADFDFQKDVVELSQEKSVLVDFWAEWCGPCKILGPVLEQLEQESNGKWKLVKINTEDFPEIASYFRIQSIPNCKLIYQGKLVDEFSGALPKPAVKKWLDDHLAKLLPPEEEPVSDDYGNWITESPQTYPNKNLLDKINTFLQTNPDHPAANLDAIKHLVFYEPEASIQKLNSLKDVKNIEELKQDFDTISSWMNLVESAENANHNLLQARKSLLEGNAQLAIDIIIDTVMKNPAFHDQLPRRVGIALFRFWGSRHPLTLENRKLFDMAIY